MTDCVPGMQRVVVICCGVTLHPLRPRDAMGTWCFCFCFGQKVFPGVLPCTRKRRTGTMYPSHPGDATGARSPRSKSQRPIASRGRNGSRFPCHCHQRDSRKVIETNILALDQTSCIMGASWDDLGNFFALTRPAERKMSLQMPVFQDMSPTLLACRKAERRQQRKTERNTDSWKEGSPPSGGPEKLKSRREMYWNQ